MRCIHVQLPQLTGRATLYCYQLCTIIQKNVSRVKSGDAVYIVGCEQLDETRPN